MDDATPLGGVVGSLPAFDVNESGVVVVRVPLKGGSSSKAILVVSGSGVESVAAVGDPSPGGGFFSDLRSFALGPDGTVAFSADIAGGTTPGGLFKAAAGEVEPLVLLGDQAPSGGTFSDLRDPRVDAAGTVVFRVLGGTSPAGIFRRPVGRPVEAVAAAGEASPGGGTFTSFGKPVVNDAGAVAFTANVSGGPKGIFLAEGGAVRAVVLVGQSAPGGGVFGALFRPALGEDGSVAFRAAVDGGPSPRGIFVASGGSLERVVAGGEDSPVPSSGRASAQRFILFGNEPAMDPAGRVAFWATLSEGGEGIFLAAEGSIVATALSGDPAPVGGEYLGFSDPRFAGSGRQLFAATLSDPQVNKAVVLDGGVRAAALRVSCDRGERLGDALGMLADGGMVAVSGTCRENVVVSDVARRIIQGVKVRGRPAALEPADPSRPALEILGSAGPTAVVSLAIRGGNPALRAAGRGHFLSGNRVFRGGLDLEGSGHTVVSNRVQGAPGTGMRIGASRSLVSHNLVRKAAGSGMVVAGSISAVVGNRVVRNRGDGLAITGTGNTLTANRAVRNRGDGIVAVAGNVDGGRNRGRGNGGTGVSIP